MDNEWFEKRDMPVRNTRPDICENRVQKRMV